MNYKLLIGQACSTLTARLDSGNLQLTNLLFPSPMSWSLVRLVIYFSALCREMQERLEFQHHFLILLKLLRQTGIVKTQKICPP